VGAGSGQWEGNGGARKDVDGAEGYRRHEATMCR
jgi:hypothetical protein